MRQEYVNTSFLDQKYQILQFVYNCIQLASKSFNFYLVLHLSELVVNFTPYLDIENAPKSIARVF